MKVTEATIDANSAWTDLRIHLEGGFEICVSDNELIELRENGKVIQTLSLAIGNNFFRDITV